MELEDPAVLRVTHHAIGRTDPLLDLYVTWKGTKRLVLGGFRPDLVHAHVFSAAWIGAVIARRLKVPLVATEHATTFSTNAPRPPTKGETLKAKFAWRRAEYVLPVSNVLALPIKRLVPEARVRIVPNVVDVSLFRPQIESQQPGHIASVGLLTEEKGFDQLLEALAILRDSGHEFHLDLVGDGPLRNRLETLASSLRIQQSVRFHGLLSKEQTSQVVAGSQMFVSASRFETFGVAIAEAIACGVPVVATDCGGPTDFVTARVGEIVPPNNAAALADAIVKVSRRKFDPADLARYATDRFSHETVGSQLAELYDLAMHRDA